jgi:hypothetical protein
VFSQHKRETRRSPSCRNLAWRLRSGKRWGGRLPTPASVAKPRDRQTRGALLRRSRGFRAALLAARQLATKQAARQTRSWFWDICRGIGLGWAAKWVIDGLLLDRRSEQVLLAEQKREVKALKSQIGHRPKALPPSRS